MSSKSQQKKARKEAKRQRSIPSQPWVSSPPQQTRPDITISEAIRNIAAPLRTQYSAPQRMEAMISLRVIQFSDMGLRNR